MSIELIYDGLRQIYRAYSDGKELQILKTTRGHDGRLEVILAATGENCVIETEYKAVKFIEADDATLFNATQFNEILKNIPNNDDRMRFIEKAFDCVCLRCGDILEKGDYCTCGRDE